ncbi:DUF4625 domain-containing protein [Aquimarina algiphila]|uniref:DUF4625 domain-containing protein n=1 Tax=Aquimarina algiphila TaxID=2047982 RepID=UPI0023304BB1|nr:DUF4625 domain-containing protein [Aquimarina algiphila]
MKKHTWIPLCCLSIFISCLNEDSDDNVDLGAPSIKAMEGTSGIQPSYFFTTSPENPNIPIAFSIEDPSGIKEIKIESHSGFDGHTHGKSVQNDGQKFKLFSLNEVMDAETFEDQTRITYSSEVFADHRNPEIADDELIIAGPYHFSIQATDVEGNQTTYADNTTYHTTVYIHRPYAPQVELSEIRTSGGSISGRIYRNNEHPANSNLSFLWIYIEDPDENNPDQEGIVLKEKIFGKSNWPHQFRPNSGEDLPNVDEIQLETLFEDDPDFFNNLTGNRLVIWAEDTNGNISVHQFNN